VLPQTIDVDHSRREALVAAMTAMQPIAALLLEAGVSYADMMRLVRRAYVDEAAARQRAAGSRPTISRIAASTGLSRPDVSEALSAPPIPNNARDLAPRAGDRILAGWRSDPDFLNQDGTPKPLPYLEGAPSFSTLVKRHGPDIPPRAMLKELIGSGHVEVIDEDLFRPSNAGSKPSESRAEAIISFGPKMNALGSTLIRNLISAPESGLFESLALASQVAPNLSPKISRELERRCRTFTQSIDRYLMDQQLSDETLSENKHHSLGVIVAVVERSPEKEIPKRKRGRQ
jgi:Family of unknown function (DUF6502)